MKVLVRRSLLILLGLSFSEFSSFAAQTSRGVGSGLAFAPPSYGAVVNPASVASAPQAAIAGSYRFANENPFIGFVGGTGGLGLGADYRKEGPKDVEGEKSQKQEIVEAAAAAKILFLTLGGTLKKEKDSHSNYDLSGMMDLGPFRLGGILRDLRNGVQRADVFLGMKVSHFHLEIDFKKPKKLNSTSWLVDAGLAMITADFAIAVGYDATYEDSILQKGNFHGGLSYRLLDNLFVEGMYRPFAQEWSTAELMAGARLVF